MIHNPAGAWIYTGAQISLEENRVVLECGTHAFNADCWPGPGAQPTRETTDETKRRQQTMAPYHIERPKSLMTQKAQMRQKRDIQGTRNN
jgi:hypothetical protein